LYLNPPENALVLCVDEKPSIQALDRTQPLLPLRAKKPRSWTNEYVHHATQNVAGGPGNCHRQSERPEIIKGTKFNWTMYQF